jgi:hypothetical protein
VGGAAAGAAALYLALVPSRAPSAARHCLRTGFLGLRALAGVYRVEVPTDPRPDTPIALTYEEAEGDGDDMRHAVLADRGEPPEPLAPQVLELGIAEHAHGVLLRWRRLPDWSSIALGRRARVLRGRLR